MLGLLWRAITGARAAWRAVHRGRPPKPDGDPRSALIANLAAMR